MTSAAETTPSLKRRAVVGLALATTLAAIALGGATGARADPVDLAVVDRETGQTLQVWRHDGRLFVAGRPGARYGLRVTNNTNNRVLVVMSVDGVNVLSGETAGYDQRGYIFRPRESYEVTGWRKTDSTVAAFTFAPLASSYAALTGRPSDVGVIGLAMFNERVRPPPVIYAPPPPAVSNQAESARAQMAPLAAPAPVVGTNISGVKAAGSPVQRLNREDTLRSGAGSLGDALGTGHGDIERSVVINQAFERASAYPQFTWQVQYNSRDNLVALGVIPSAPQPVRPRAFPGAGYVPDPPR